MRSPSFLPVAAILLSPCLARTFSDIGPKNPGFALPPPLARNKTCVVQSHGGQQDDSVFVLDAVQSCNPGGHIIFAKENEYLIGTALNLTGLQNVDIDIRGNITFSNDTSYWQSASFKYPFQNASTFFQLGGSDVNVYGGGTLDGNGQVWYDLYAEDIYTLRPILFGTVGLHGGRIENLKLRYSPQWYNFVVNSSEVVFSGIDIAGKSSSENEAKNTDGWDTYRSSNIVIQNSHINNGDDCVSFKPNSTDIVVQNLVCNGSHGISVGSLGQYIGEVDIVKNIYVYNISMSDASDGARIKVWPGITSALSGDLQGGGGSGAVSNITYELMNVTNVDYAIEITQCYGQSNLTLCNEFPSNLTISGITMRDFTGTTSKAHDPIIGYAVCSSPDVCGNVTFEDIDVKSPSGGNGWECGNIEGIEEMVNCTKID